MKRQPTLTDAQRRILTAAARKGGTPADQHHTPTVELLEACALVTLHDHDNIGDWTILTTREGRHLLHRPVLEDRPPLFLARAGRIRYRQLPNRRWVVDEDADGDGDYTTDPRQSIDSDQLPGATRTTAVEVTVTPSDLADFAERARQREARRQRGHAKTLDSMTPRERLEQAQSAARRQGVDVSSDVRLIRHMLVADRTRDVEVAVRKLEVRLRHRAA